MKGIYEITNLKTGTKYIGSSSNINKRFNTHKRTLAKGTHHNVHLQRSFDKHGIDNFSFSVIEECEDLFVKEASYIENSTNLYNIGGVCGGDNYSNNPNKEAIRAKLISILKTIPKPLPRYGSDNPNWRGGPSKCTCGTPIAKSASCCISCRDITGSNNPFYGKTHSEDIKALLRDVNTGRKSPCRKEVNSPNGVFESLTALSISEGVVPGTILNRIRSTRPKWSEYYYVNA